MKRQQAASLDDGLICAFVFYFSFGGGEECFLNYHNCRLLTAINDDLLFIPATAATAKRLRDDGIYRLYGHLSRR